MNTEQLVKATLGADAFWSVNKAMARAQGGLIGQMLTRAKANLKLKGPVIAKKGAGIQRAVRYRHLRQKMVDQRLLARAQLMSLGAAIKPVECGWILHRAGA